MFGEHYTASTPAFQRVKYGCLNHTLDPAGVACSSQYGNSFLLLSSDSVRARATVAPHDSLDGAPPLATLEHFAHLLLQYREAELQEAISVALGEKR